MFSLIPREFCNMLCISPVLTFLFPGLIAMYFAIQVNRFLRDELQTPNTGHRKWAKKTFMTFHTDWLLGILIYGLLMIPM